MCFGETLAFGLLHMTLYDYNRTRNDYTILNGYRKLTDYYRTLNEYYRTLNEYYMTLNMTLSGQWALQSHSSA